MLLRCYFLHIEHVNFIVVYDDYFVHVCFGALQHEFVFLVQCNNKLLNIRWIVYNSYTVEIPLLVRYILLCRTTFHRQMLELLGHCTKEATRKYLHMTLFIELTLIYSAITIHVYSRTGGLILGYPVSMIYIEHSNCPVSGLFIHLRLVRGIRWRVAKKNIWESSSKRTESL